MSAAISDARRISSMPPRRRPWRFRRCDVPHHRDLGLPRCSAKPTARASPPLRVSFSLRRDLPEDAPSTADIVDGAGRHGDIVARFWPSAGARGTRRASHWVTGLDRSMAESQGLSAPAFPGPCVEASFPGPARARRRVGVINAGTSADAQLDRTKLSIFPRRRPLVRHLDFW